MTRLCTPVIMQCLTIISFFAAARSGTGDPGEQNAIVFAASWIRLRRGDRPMRQRQK